MNNLSKLRSVPIRDIWQHEARDFSNWLILFENLNLLGNEVGIKLELIRREAIAGKYRVDILAKEKETNKIVIIENQLEETDHSHLGQLIAYSSHYDAKYIIWIVKDLRVEHEKSIEWLNFNLAEDIKIFLVKIDIYKIDNSFPAPKFTIISKPYGWTNKLFRKQSEIEEISKEQIELEASLKIFQKKSIFEFLDGYISIDYLYSKKDIIFEYNKRYPEDCLFYQNKIRDFKKALKVWAQTKGLTINPRHQNNKYKGDHKMGGVEYFTFSKI